MLSTYSLIVQRESFQFGLGSQWHEFLDEHVVKNVDPYLVTGSFADSKTRRRKLVKVISFLICDKSISF